MEHIDPNSPHLHRRAGLVDGDGGLSERIWPSGRRRASRLRVRLPLRLSTRIETRLGILLDLSLNGAKVTCDAQLRVGQEAVIEWGEYESFGEIVWSRYELAGIAFLEPITPDALLATRKLDEAAHLPKDKDILRQIARHWVQGHTRL